ncbi:MAG: hypothetical protein US74_C0021G0021 [Parcubacteria group bacterium GW2011_GWA2_38_13]|nr:MAG: hypothetical protein US74_C0021G0021 [Parcubacteria group bacterium GW2011_GWA2_38_13]
MIKISSGLNVELFFTSFDSTLKKYCVDEARPVRTNACEVIRLESLTLRVVVADAKLWVAYIILLVAGLLVVHAKFILASFDSTLK